MLLTLENILACLPDARRVGDEWIARCPAHEDHHPSLSIGEGKNGKPLLHCHAGCHYNAICAALNIMPGPIPRGPLGRVVTTYEYRDEDDTILYQVRRYTPKTFRSYRPDRQRGWVPGLANVPRIPYRLPMLRRAACAGETVYYVEGEKDVESALALGLTATTLAGGAQALIPDEFVTHFRGAGVVVVLADNDDAGRQYACRIADALTAGSIPCKLLELPGLEPKGDLTDWLSAGGTTEQLQEFVECTPLYMRRIGTAPEAFDTNVPREPMGTTLSVQRPAPYTLRVLYERPELLQPPPAVIPNLAWAGCSSLLSAREKTGKSTLVGQAAAALSVGGTFLGGSLTPGRTLWYAIDEPLGDSVRRFQQYGGDPDRLLLQPERPSAADLHAEIEATGASLVVIDTLAELWSGLIESDRDAGAVATFLRPYIRVIRETQAALIVLHHTTKLGTEYRGSVQLGASVDTVLTLRRPQVLSVQPGAAAIAGEDDEADDDGRRTLRGKGRGVTVNMRLHFDGVRYSLGDQPMPLRARIGLELDRAPASGTELADRLRIRKETVLAELKAMQRDDLIESMAKRFHLTLKGQGMLSNQGYLFTESVPAIGSHPRSLSPAGTNAETGPTETIHPHGNLGTGPELERNLAGTDVGTTPPAPVPGLHPRENSAGTEVVENRRFGCPSCSRRFFTDPRDPATPSDMRCFLCRRGPQPQLSEAVASPPPPSSDVDTPTDHKEAA